MTLSGLERILGILNGYRRRKIELEEEHEALVNLIDAICSILMVQDCLDQFKRL